MTLWLHATHQEHSFTYHPRTTTHNSQSTPLPISVPSLKCKTQGRQVTVNYGKVCLKQNRVVYAGNKKKLCKNKSSIREYPIETRKSVRNIKWIFFIMNSLWIMNPINEYLKKIAWWRYLKFELLFFVIFWRINFILKYFICLFIYA